MNQVHSKQLSSLCFTKKLKSVTPQRTAEIFPMAKFCINCVVTSSRYTSSPQRSHALLKAFPSVLDVRLIQEHWVYEKGLWLYMENTECTPVQSFA